MGNVECSSHCTASETGRRGVEDKSKRKTFEWQWETALSLRKAVHCNKKYSSCMCTNDDN
jgi:hypothetical protein